MPDMRLIDANQLMRDMCVDNAVKYGNETTEQVNNSYSSILRYQIADAINDAPTIDAVPVVRCSECAFSKKFMTGNLYCELHESYAFTVHPDGFCSRGAKNG